MDRADPRVQAVIAKQAVRRSGLGLSPPTPTPGAAPGPSPAWTALRVRVNEALTLDAGRVRTASDGRRREVEPPGVPMIDQVLAYLEEQPPAATPRSSCSFHGRAGAAAAVACLRWGSYLAVLADRDKPLWDHAARPEPGVAVSRIRDAEMRRLNVEISYAFATWTDRLRAAICAGRATQFVEQVLAYLPTSRRCARPPRHSTISGLASQDVSNQIAALPPEVAMDLSYQVAATHAHPSRVFANRVVNFAWRNGPVEEMHAGVGRGTPLDRCRLTPREVQRLVGQAGDTFAVASAVIEDSVMDRKRTWPEIVLPFAFVEPMTVPTGWSVTAASCAMTLGA